jgi:hypothetical protein
VNTEAKRERVSEAWRIGASALSIRVEAPYLLKTAEGKEVVCIAYLPDFGDTKGMIIGLVCRTAYKKDNGLKSAALALGLYYSFINPEMYDRYDEGLFKEALVDWGFFGDEDRRPDWLLNPTRSD